ncbi:MAG: hypothetical protein SH850_14370 [Planctomycetaceae bacterium]|nr:hypothetical protein [Planctomycetaceae bacterium]
MKLILKMFKYLSLGTVICVGGIVLWLVLIQIESQAAMREWSRLGGGVGVQSNARFGPAQMMIGTMPGRKTETDMKAIKAAALRLNRWPGCRGLSIGDLDWSCEEIKELMDPLRLDHFHIQGIALDEEFINYLANRPDLDSIAIGRGWDRKRHAIAPAFSAEAVRRLLQNSPKRTLSTGGIAFVPEEKAKLLEEFAGRLTIWK